MHISSGVFRVSACALLALGMAPATLIPAALTPAWAQERSHVAPSARELVLSNHAPRAITQVFVSSSETTDWGAERLGGGAVKPGGVLRLRLGHGQGCGVDVIVTYADGMQEEVDDIDSCASHGLALDGSGARPAAADAPAHALILLDQTPLDIVEAYVSPAATAQWGTERLGANALPTGGEADLEFRGGCLVDLRVVFENQAAEERRDLDICAQGRIAISPGWTTRVETADGRFLLRNLSGHAIAELYAYPDGAAARGPDLLAGHVAPDGASLPLSVSPGLMCRATLRAVLVGGETDMVRSGVDFCAQREVTLRGLQAKKE